MSLDVPAIRRLAVGVVATVLASQALAQAGERPLDIVPGRGIGPIKLGARPPSLPRVQLEGDVGSMDSIRFALVNGVVSELWISDVNAFPRGLRFKGRLLPRRLTLAAIKTIFGPCHEGPEELGGSLFDCARNVSVGATGGGAKLELRLRLHPARSFEPPTSTGRSRSPSEREGEAKVPLVPDFEGD